MFLLFSFRNEVKKEMKICVVINTFNEGPDISRTVKSFREGAGESEVSFVVIADTTTDASCDSLPDDVVVLKPNERLGCGRSKHLGVKHALIVFKPDVILHSDGHNRIIQGTLSDIGKAAM